MISGALASGVRTFTYCLTIDTKKIQVLHPTRVGRRWARLALSVFISSIPEFPDPCLSCMRGRDHMDYGSCHILSPGRHGLGIWQDICS